MPARNSINRHTTKFRNPYTNETITDYDRKRNMKRQQQQEHTVATWKQNIKSNIIYVCNRRSFLYISLPNKNI